MADVERYRERLLAMRSRLVQQIEGEIDDARESISKPGEQVRLHTHNADMDVSGLDEAIGVGHALENHLKTVDRFLGRLSQDGESLLANERERERLDALLETNDLFQAE